MYDLHDESDSDILKDHGVSVRIACPNINSPDITFDGRPNDTAKPHVKDFPNEISEKTTYTILPKREPVCRFSRNAGRLL